MKKLFLFILFIPQLIIGMKRVEKFTEEDFMKSRLKDIVELVKKKHPEKTESQLKQLYKNLKKLCRDCNGK